MRVEAGKKDQQIFIEKKVEINNEGAISYSYAADSPPDMVWAYVLSQRGSESFQSARLNAAETIRVCIYYRSDITTDDRFKWNDRIYNIAYVDDSNKRRNELWMTASLQAESE